MNPGRFFREAGEPVALLYVTESRGSSPGRKGFRMAVRSDGETCGSIGGGVMEHGLAEWARERLRSGDHEPVLRRQIHRQGAGDDRSGLICSGEQTVAFVVVNPEQAVMWEEGTGFLTLSARGVEHWAERPEGEFWAVEELGRPATVCIIGGGHVGLALSRTMAQLGFRVEIFDDRPGLDTIRRNRFADSCHIGPLENVLAEIPEGEHVWVVAVTFGIDADREVLRRLAGKTFRYFGLMGSRAKLLRLKEEFGELEGIHAPVGLSIHSETPEEIAISIAAEIIRVKNS